MMFIWRSGGQLKKWGVEPPVPAAIRALMKTDEVQFQTEADGKLFPPERKLLIILRIVASGHVTGAAPDDKNNDRVLLLR